MKTFKWRSLLLLLVIASCSPFQEVPEKVRMRYSVDGVLCRDYKFIGDTLILIDAGYYANKIYQKKVAEIRMIKFDKIFIVDVLPYHLKSNYNYEYRIPNVDNKILDYQLDTVNYGKPFLPKYSRSTKVYLGNPEFKIK